MVQTDVGWQIIDEVHLHTAQAFANQRCKILIDFVAERTTIQTCGGDTRRARAQERVEYLLARHGKHLNESPRQLLGKRRKMSILTFPGEVPVTTEECIPLFGGKSRGLLLLAIRCGRLAALAEQEDELVVELDDAIARERIGTHHRATTRAVCGGHLLPDDGAHVVEADRFAESNDLRADGNHFVAAIVGGAGELIADIDTEATPWTEHPMAFGPHQIQVVDVILVGVAESDLLIPAVVLQLPVRRRGHNELYVFVVDAGHLARVAQHDTMEGWHRILWCRHAQ